MLDHVGGYLGFESFEAFVLQGLEIKSKEYAREMAKLRERMINLRLSDMPRLKGHMRRMMKAYNIKFYNGFGLLTVGNKKLNKSLPRESKHSNLVGLELLPVKWMYSDSADTDKWGFEKGLPNICPNAGVCGVLGNCLAFSRPARSAQRKRTNRKRFLFDHPELFLCALFYEMEEARFIYRMPMFRTNVLSDIIWEHIFPPFILDMLNGHWYDYTKIRHRLRYMPDGLDYKLTYSFSEKDSMDDLPVLMAIYERVSMVFNHRFVFPTEIQGFPVVDGDHHDYRMEKGVIIGLRTKARLKMNKNQDSPMIQKGA